MSTPEENQPFQPGPQDWEIFRQSRPQDYDGHTHFDRMSPAERLAWVEGAALFVLEMRARSRHPASADRVEPENLG